MGIGEFIEVSNRATTSEALFGLYNTAMSACGFDRIVFSLMTDHPTTGRKAGHGIITNYPLDWIKYYREKWLELIDPVRQFVHAAEGPFTWNSLPRYFRLSKIQRECLMLGAEAGLKDGVGIPLRGPGNAFAGVGAASSAGGVDMTRDILSYAYLCSQQFYTSWLGLERKPQRAEIVSLSRQELEVLKWCVAGKSRQETGLIIGISENTVKFHLRNAQKKLCARDSTTAAFIALRLGFIQY
jgi:DNA-binding CsgD family transcriptional regulator